MIPKVHDFLQAQEKWHSEGFPFYEVFDAKQNRAFAFYDSEWLLLEYLKAPRTFPEIINFAQEKLGYEPTIEELSSFFQIIVEQNLALFPEQTQPEQNQVVVQPPKLDINLADQKLATQIKTPKLPTESISFAPVESAKTAPLTDQVKNTEGPPSITATPSKQIITSAVQHDSSASVVQENPPLLQQKETQQSTMNKQSAFTEQGDQQKVSKQTTILVEKINSNKTTIKPTIDKTTEKPTDQTTNEIIDKTISTQAQVHLTQSSPLSPLNNTTVLSQSEHKQPSLLEQKSSPVLHSSKEGPEPKPMWTYGLLLIVFLGIGVLLFLLFHLFYEGKP